MTRGRPLKNFKINEIIKDDPLPNKDEIKQVWNSINLFDLMPSNINSNPVSSQLELINNNNYSMISLNRTILSYAYLTFGVIQTAIDQPVEDAFRGGIIVKSDELTADEIEFLQNYIEKSHFIEKIKTAIKWARLFGGSALIINTDQDPTSELNFKLIKKNTPLGLITADRWEVLFSYAVENDVKCPFNYYGQPINKSRVIKFLGKEAPSFLRRQLQGWGMSECERMLRTINLYVKEQNTIFELIDEAKIDVFKVKGFNSSLATSQGQTQIKKRVELANMQKNFQSGISMDSEDDYQQKVMNFSGLAEILKQIMVMIASDVKMPMTKLFGMSASGFNSGEDDIENYNSMVESEIRSKNKNHIISIYELSAQKLFGFIPNLNIEFKPLRVMSEEQEVNIKNTKYNMITSMFDRGLIDEKQYFSALKKENVINIEGGIKNVELPDYIQTEKTSLTQPKIKDSFKKQFNNIFGK